MAEVLITPQAQGDVERAVADLELPADTWSRIASRYDAASEHVFVVAVEDGRSATAASSARA
jgi:hypothetical protein